MDLISICMATNKTIAKLKDDGIEALTLIGADGKRYELTVDGKGSLSVTVKGGDPSVGPIVIIPPQTVKLSHSLASLYDGVVDVSGADVQKQELFDAAHNNTFSAVTVVLNETEYVCIPTCDGTYFILPGDGFTLRWYESDDAPKIEINKNVIAEYESVNIYAYVSEGNV